MSSVHLPVIAIAMPVAAENQFKAHQNFEISRDPFGTGLNQKIYYENDKVTLNFQALDIRVALQLLTELGEQDMIVSESVNGVISLHLRDVSWQDALVLILKTQGLGKRNIGDVMLIAPITEMVKQQATDEVWTPLVLQVFPIHYADAPDIVTLLKATDTASSARTKLGSDARSNSVWIQDTPEQLSIFSDLITAFDQPVKQVLIEAQLVLANQSWARELGIRYQFNAVDELLPAVGAPLSLNRSFASLNTSATTADITIGALDKNILLDLELHALETEGKGEVISRPHLLTASGQTAVIESGEEIPYQESTSSGATATAFKKAVLSLKVTPRITPDNRVLLDLQVNQDTPSLIVKADGNPGINTKSIKTNVTVENGETLVLGGIYKQSENTTVERIPFLGELPGIGALFRYEVTSTEQEELLIFITPNVIE